MIEVLGLLALVGSGTQITLTATKVLVDVGCNPMIRVVAATLQEALKLAVIEVVKKCADKTEKPRCFPRLMAIYKLEQQ